MWRIAHLAVLSDSLEVYALIAFSEDWSDVPNRFHAAVMLRFQVFQNLLAVCSPINLSALFRADPLLGFPFQVSDLKASCAAFKSAVYPLVLLDNQMCNTQRHPERYRSAIASPIAPNCRVLKKTLSR